MSGLLGEVRSEPHHNIQRKPFFWTDIDVICSFGLLRGTISKIVHIDDEKGANHELMADIKV